MSGLELPDPDAPMRAGAAAPRAESGPPRRAAENSVPSHSRILPLTSAGSLPFLGILMQALFRFRLPYCYFFNCCSFWFCILILVSFYVGSFSHLDAAATTRFLASSFWV